MNPDSALVHIVDDDSSVCRSLGRLLRSLGLRFGAFASGDELLADSRRSEAACLIIDVHMPRMGGYALARRLAEAGVYSPIIFITAQAPEADRWQAHQPPAVALLVKPFSEAELIAALELALGSALDLGSPT